MLIFANEIHAPALRVIRAETWLTVYRVLNILIVIMDGNKMHIACLLRETRTHRFDRPTEQHTRKAADHIRGNALTKMDIIPPF